jgi:hypothetical protein
MHVFDPRRIRTLMILLAGSGLEAIRPNATEPHF